MTQIPAIKRLALGCGVRVGEETTVRELTEKAMHACINVRQQKSSLDIKTIWKIQQALKDSKWALL